VTPVRDFGKKVLLPVGVLQEVDSREREGLREPHEGRDQERTEFVARLTRVTERTLVRITGKGGSGYRDF
jgi:hypothetical protein